MIIYGWNNRVIKEAPVEKVQCGNCGNENVRIKIMGFYAHVFWIPLFPYKKKGYFECDHCKHAIEDNNLADQQKELMSRLKKSIKFPKYMFSGSAVLLALITWLFVSSKMEDSRELEFLNSPQAGDVYHLKNNDEPTEFKYYLWKTVEAFDDSVYFIQNAYGYNMVPKALISGDGFLEDLYVIDKAKLMEMFESGEIVKVQRNYSESSGFNRILENVPGDSVITD